MEKNTAVSQSYLFLIAWSSSLLYCLFKEEGAIEMLLFDEVIVARVRAHDTYM